MSLYYTHAPASICPKPFSKIFFSKTSWPIKAKFHVEPPWIGGTKVYLWHLGHMVITLQTSSPELYLEPGILSGILSHTILYLFTILPIPGSRYSGQIFMKLSYSGSSSFIQVITLD